MSYTLRGRLESRLAVLVLPLLVACVLAGALRTWWPVELAGLMTVVGLVLDAELYHRLLPYQPGWVALPLGVLELALVVPLAVALTLAGALGEWWPVELCGLMAGVGLAADLAYHPALPYQPGW